MIELQRQTLDWRPLIEQAKTNPGTWVFVRYLPRKSDPSYANRHGLKWKRAENQEGKLCFYIMSEQSS